MTLSKEEIAGQNALTKEFLRGLFHNVKMPPGFKIFIDDHHADFQVKPNFGDPTAYQDPQFFDKLCYFARISGNPQLVFEIKTFFGRK